MDNNRQQQPKIRQGIYNNTYIMDAASLLVGNVVQIRVQSGTIYEGVLRTFSPNFDVCLEFSTVIKRANNNKVADDGKTEQKYMTLPRESVVIISAKDFDFQYATATSGAFQTDAATAISDGSRFDGLDGASNGWDANEMSFDDSLSTYTMALDTMDSDEFQEAEAKAEKSSTNQQTPTTANTALWNTNTAKQSSVFGTGTVPKVKNTTTTSDASITMVEQPKFIILKKGGNPLKCILICICIIIFVIITFILVITILFIALSEEWRVKFRKPPLLLHKNY